MTDIAGGNQADLADIARAGYQGRHQGGTGASQGATRRRFCCFKVMNAPEPLLREINHLPQQQHSVQVMREAILVRLYNVGRG